FGIAQAVDDPRLTTSGNLVGSPAFMAPERVAGSDAVPASDLWSLGAALFFAVEGIVAFERTSTAATLHAIMNEVPYLTRAQGPLASAIMGLLITGPDARIAPGQAHELLAMAAQQGDQSATTVSTATTRIAGQQATVLNGRQYSGAAAAGRRRGRLSRALWMTGSAIVGVALLVAGFFLGRWIYLPDTDEQLAETLTYGRGGDVSEFAERSSYDSYGCVDVAGERGTKITEDSWLDCDELHVAEVYAVDTVYGDSTDDDAEPAEYPDREQLRDTAEQSCGLAFHSNLIDDSVRDELRYRALVPSRA